MEVRAKPCQECRKHREMIAACEQMQNEGNREAGDDPARRRRTGLSKCIGN